MKGVIICGGSIKDPRYIKSYLDGAELIIAADSGAAFLQTIGVRPHVLSGDFDSITEADYASVKDSGAEILKYPAEKDKTDSELAIELALERGCDEVVLLGALGNRADHSLANIFLLKKLVDHGVKGYLADEHNEVYLTGTSITLKREQGAFLSLLPLTERAEGVTTKGLYYPLKDATLVTGSTWGVSNEFVEDTATVSVSKGLLLVIKTREHQ